MKKGPLKRKRFREEQIVEILQERERGRKVSVKFLRTERVIEQLRPLLRTMTMLMSQLVEAAKRLDLDED